MEQRTCRDCHEPKPLTSFAQAGNDPRYRRRVCNSCRQRKDYAKNREKRNQHLRQRRIDNPVRTLLRDSLRSDRKRGIENDLTVEFIANEVAKTCSYCGGSNLVGLDRIDNDKGHTQANVVPACIRCNYTRKDMPHAAWLVVAKGMREAREAGLFGDWTGRARTRKSVRSEG